MPHRLTQWLRRFAWAVLDAYPDPSSDRAEAWRLLATRQPAEDEIDAALRAAFAQCGLDDSQYAPEFDLARSGQLHAVLYHASQRLGNPLRTIDDVRALLK